MQKFKKPLIVFAAIVISIVAIVIAFISPITKYLVEKYDEEYTGRQITMAWAYVNPFTGYVHFSDLRVYEPNGDTLFLSAKGLSANFALYKLLSKTYEISECTLDQPNGIIIQNNKGLNFDDLVKRFSSKDTAASAPKEPVHFNILNIKINEGEFHYHETIAPIRYSIKNVTVESNGYRWDSDTIAAKVSFESGIGSGDLKGNFTINTANLDYRFEAVAHQFDLNIIEQYLKELTNYGTFSALLEADVKAKGNFNDEEEITASGMMAIHAFHFGKTKKEDYVSFDKLVLAVNKLSPKNHTYIFDSVSISRPYLKYERYDYLDNLETMFGKNGANVSSSKVDSAQFNLVVEIAKYVKVLARNFFKSSYKVNRLAIYDGDLKFNDYSLGEKFGVDLNPLFVFADSIDKNNKTVSINLKSGILPYGNVSASLSINPKDSSDFDLHYQLQRLPISMFNPYTIFYTSFPLDRGTVEFDGRWKVRNGIIQSDNHLVIIDPRVTKRLKNKNATWIPMPLIMSFIRERGNVIDYEIPITGDLKNPKFHLHDVLVDLLENTFVKPATTSYRIKVKTIEREIEKSLALKWPIRNSSLLPTQEKFIDRITDFLEKNPEASITVHPQLYTLKEKESILLFEAKKKYFLVVNHKDAKSFCEEDSEKVDRMSIKDSMFVRYLNKQLKKDLIFTVQEKCAHIIDSSTVNTKLHQLNKARESAFRSFFKKDDLEKRITISANRSVIPYNGFSFYKIEYKGEVPESLMEAYKTMNELNNETPRDKFKKERRQNRGIL